MAWTTQDVSYLLYGASSRLVYIFFSSSPLRILLIFMYPDGSNDLWKYDPVLKLWYWVDGNGTSALGSSTYPGSIWQSASAISNGDLWFYGGWRQENCMCSDERVEKQRECCEGEYLVLFVTTASYLIFAFSSEYLCEFTALALQYGNQHLENVGRIQCHRQRELPSGSCFLYNVGGFIRYNLGLWRIRGN